MKRFIYEIIKIIRKPENQEYLFNGFLPFLSSWFPYCIIIFCFFTTAFLWEAVTGKYGDPVTVTEKTSIGAITKEPEKYLNKIVRVEGELFDVCQDMGCWFSIKDSSGAIYIDLSMGIKFTMPKKSNGYRAIVQGLVTNEGGKTTIKLKATGTEILGK